jgi:hypothetical protein
VAFGGANLKAARAGSSQTRLSALRRINGAGWQKPLKVQRSPSSGAGAKERLDFGRNQTKLNRRFIYICQIMILMKMIYQEARL